MHGIKSYKPHLCRVVSLAHVFSILLCYPIVLFYSTLRHNADDRCGSTLLFAGLHLTEQLAQFLQRHAGHVYVARAFQGSVVHSLAYLHIQRT